MANDKLTLFLFDIDGTLVQTGRAGLRGLARAFDHLYGAADIVERVPFAGRTDRWIVLEALGLIGRTPDEPEVLRVRDAYCRFLGEEIHRPVGHPKGVLPGVTAALDALDARPDAAVVALLTGNFVRGAEIKLGYFDLWRRFTFGAFGDAHVDRRDLVPLALAEARARALDVSASDVVVIGDTPLDVDCAHAGGARAVAVATGPYDLAALRATGADLVVPDLSDWPAIWNRLRSEGGSES